MKKIYCTERFSRFVLASIMIILVILMSLQVFTRYVLNNPTGWTDESSAITLVYLTFLCSGLVVKRGQTFRINLLRYKLKNTKAGIVIDQVIKILEISFIIVAIIYSIPLIIQLWNQYTGALRIPKSWVALAVPLGLCGMLLRLTHEFIALLKKHKFLN